MTACMERTGSGGFTLIEVVIALTVLAIGATGYLVLVNTSLQRSARPVIQQQAHAIAQSYLEEILAQPFCDPDISTDCPAACPAAPVCGSACTASEVSRNLYDEVCDYDLLNDADAADINGGIPGLEAYTVDVTVVDGGVNLNGLLSNSGHVVRVDVTVTDDTGEVDITLSGYKANY